MPIIKKKGNNVFRLDYHLQDIQIVGKNPSSRFFRHKHIKQDKLKNTVPHQKTERPPFLIFTCI